jgi:D-glycero-D-manno-heptose 1,7-bisphosphate phosphatase
MKRAVFLDRDGVLNPMVERNGRWAAPLDLAAFAVYPWAAESVTRLKAAGLFCLVATNQPEIASGELEAGVLEAMHRRLAQDVPVDGIYVCPHRDADGCACRKPRPGLLEQATVGATSKRPAAPGAPRSWWTDRSRARPGRTIGPRTCAGR